MSEHRTLEAFRLLDPHGMRDGGCEVVHLVAWCDRCADWHWHGGGSACDPTPVYGHRTAHCVDGPARGYVLGPAGTITRKEMALRRRAARAARREAGRR